MECPCQQQPGVQFGDCCQPLIERVIKAPTAVELMRSRYSAFATGNADYLEYSWHPDTCPEDIRTITPLPWTGLTILHTDQGGLRDSDGVVEFIATYTHGNLQHKLHEVSRFTRYEGRWVYYDGEFPES